VALQRPLQTPISPALLCSCRAETVPAHRTAVTIAASNVDVIFLLMINFLSRIGKLNLWPFTSSTRLRYRLAAMNPHTPEVAVGLLKTHPQPRTLGQGFVLVQKWCWQVVS
jgi:hypothetical protein